MDDGGHRLVLVVVEQRDRAVGAGRGQLHPASLSIDVLTSLRQPVQDLEARIPQRARQRGRQVLRRRPLQLEHERADVRAGQPRPEHSREERDRQGDEAHDLPPEQVLVGDPRRALDKREDALPHGAQREDHGREHERRQQPAGPRRRPDEPAHDQRDEEAGEEPPDEDDEHFLQRDRELAVLPGQQEALGRLAHEPKLLAAVVDEEDRERKEERGRVADAHQRPLGPAGHLARRVGEDGVRGERVGDFAHQEEDREDQLVVAVAELAQQEEDARRDQERPEPVPGPRDQAISPATRKDQATATMAADRAGVVPAPRLSTWML